MFLFFTYYLNILDVIDIRMKLKINVPSFVDCLVLLDGHLESLSTLIITVQQIFDLVPPIEGEVSTT